MQVLQHASDFRRLSSKELDLWSNAEAAAVSDCLQRAQAMDAGIKPLATEMRLVGQARTVRCAVGDNSALHAAIDLVDVGDVLVADAGGFLGNAVWGGLMTAAARQKGIAGLIVDGCVRDRAEIVSVGYPCFSRGTVPAGPHKNFGGEIDCAISCGGVAVCPGDLVVADGDGVTIVPLGKIEAVFEAYTIIKRREANAILELQKGGTLADIYGVPKVTQVKGAKA